MIFIQGNRFIDEFGRTLMLRGVNLGGSTKVPMQPDGATHLREGFFNHREVSFKGRPFPLSEADEHFTRLRKWGFNFLRFLITWEAVEHAGPGQYDEEYLDYLTAVVEKAGQYDLQLFIDPHQDVWSRFSGGDGAPGWTLEMVGFNLPLIQQTGAAIVQQATESHYPQMIWFTNSEKLAAATMFTLFFAGDDLAPQTRIEGIPAQEFLQGHYIEAVRQVAMRLKNFDHVIGYDTLNEPVPGYIGWKDASTPGDFYPNGENPSPFQSMLLGAGYSQEVDLWRMSILGPRRQGTRLVNPDEKRVWQDNYNCVWQQNGVWDVDANGKPLLLQPDYFANHNGRAIHFGEDYLKPFINRYASSIREVDPGALIFIETAPEAAPPVWEQDDAQRIAYAPHWYDVVVLSLKRFIPWLGYDTINRKILLGSGRIQESCIAQIRERKEQAKKYLNNPPVLIGETGIAYDLNNARAYRTGDFTDQVRAMDRTMCALEANLLSFTVWNYTSDNNNTHGDLWNGEDLSIFSRDQQDNPDDINSGGRALEAILRPYPIATAGEPLEMSFDYQTRKFLFRFRHQEGIQEPTVLYLPEFQYPGPVIVTVSDGQYKIDREHQQLLYWNTSEIEVHTLEIMPGKKT